MAAHAQMELKTFYCQIFQYFYNCVSHFGCKYLLDWVVFWGFFFYSCCDAPSCTAGSMIDSYVTSFLATYCYSVLSCNSIFCSHYSLLCGVQELVLAATAVTDPDAHVCPEAADCVNIAPFQLGDLHCVYVLQPLGIDLKRQHNLLSWKSSVCDV